METSDDNQDLRLLRPAIPTTPASQETSLLFGTSLPTCTTPSLASKNASGPPLLPRVSAECAARLARSQSRLFAPLPRDEPGICRQKPPTTTRKTRGQGKRIRSWKDGRVSMARRAPRRTLQNQAGQGTWNCKNRRVDCRDHPCMRRLPVQNRRLQR